MAPLLDMNRPCPVCRGTGFVVLDLPVGHVDFGKAVPCHCQENERLQRRLQRLQGIGNLEPLRRLTFESFIPEPAHLSRDRAHNLRRAYETALDFSRDPEGWLLLTGTYGCGKTHLAAAIANQRLAQGHTALFMIVPDLLDHLRATFSPQSDVSFDNLFEQLRNTPLLILDDLGTQSGTPWAQEKLFQLLNHRYSAQLPTVVTSNQRLEEIDPRLRSRLMDVKLVNYFPILAPDFRAGKNPAQSDLSTLGLYQDRQFDTFDFKRNDLNGEERANLKTIFDVCNTYAHDPRGWLVLTGTYGCGKTHLAAAIANFQADHALGDVMFVVVPDLLDHLRAAFSPQSNMPYDRRFDEVKNAPMLVLDDLGTESATPWAREKLFQLLNYRHAAMLPTVITTSHTADEIEPWLRNRMFDVSRCQFLAIRASGYRVKRSKPAAKSRPRLSRG